MRLNHCCSPVHSGMTFYIRLFAFTFVFSTDNKVEAWQSYNVRNYTVQRMEDTYRKLLGLQTCYKYNGRISCRNNSEDMSYPSLWGNVGTRKYESENRRVLDNLAHVDLKTSGRFNRPLKIFTAKTSDFNLNTFYTNPLVNHYRSPPRSVKSGSIPRETVIDIAEPGDQDHLSRNMTKQHESLKASLDEFDHKLHVVNFNKFLALSSPSKGYSGMSFVQSGLFLKMALMAISTEVDDVTKNEIDQNFGLNVSLEEKVELIKQTIGSLPQSSEGLTFRWSTRLVLRSGRQVSEAFRMGAAKALQLKIDNFDGGQEPEALAAVLNSMIEMDSGGAIRETFEEDDLIGDVQAVLITTLYFRASWRSAPTLLNGTWEFHDDPAPARPIRMIRVNDVMKYADMPEWDAEAIEIPYLTRGLSLLMLVPRGNSLRHLVHNVTTSHLRSVTGRMKDVRIAATLPLYTLRMTLLLPNKLEAIGISRLFDASQAGELRLTHAVQRLMFWAEAGRNAFKDDGLEWDEPAELEIKVDKPYIFLVRWQNITLMRGNFVL